MSNELLQNAPSGEAGFIDEKELLKRLPVSRRTLFSWRRPAKSPLSVLAAASPVSLAVSVAALLRKQKGGAQ